MRAGLRWSWLLGAALLWSACLLNRSGGGTTGSGGMAATEAGGATASSGGTGGATSTASGGMGSENCLNGVDDDADTLVDCQDDDCSGQVSCVAGLPVNALGYYILSEVSTCPEGTEQQPAYGCEKCDCAAGTGQCSVQVEAHSFLGCGGSTTSYVSGECSPNASALSAITNPPGTLMCTPTQPVPGETFSLCKLPDGAASCTSGVCAPETGQRVCALVSPSDDCGGTHDSGPIYGAPSDCSCSCNKMGESCGEVSMLAHTFTNNCNDAGVTTFNFSVGSDCDGVAAGSAEVGDSTATAECMPTEVETQLPIGRLCCVTPQM